MDTERDFSGRRSHGAAPGPLWKRLAWFAIIWCASLVALSAVAYGIRAMIL